MSVRRNPLGFAAAIAAGAAALVLGAAIWRGLAAPPPAYAQIPDAGQQRERMINELVTANAKLVEITELLRDIRDGKRGPEKKPVPPGDGG